MTPSPFASDEGQSATKILSSGLIGDRALIFILFLFESTIALFVSKITDFNGDEMWTRAVARLPIDAIWMNVLQDGKHPPLYNTLQKLLQIVLPDTPESLRLISIVSIALVPPLIYSVGRWLGGRPFPAAIASIWVGLHPLILVQAANARSYALLTLLVTAFAALLLKAWQGRGSRVLVGSVAVCIVLTHAFGLLYLASLSFSYIALLMILRPATGVEQAKRYVITLVPSGLAYLVWILVASHFSAESGGIGKGLEWVGTPDMTDRIYAAGSLAGSGGYSKATTFSLGVWSLLGSCFLWCAKRDLTVLAVGGLLVIGAIGPFIVQVLATGIVADLPFWGIRHVTPTVPLLMIAVLSSMTPLQRCPIWSTLVALSLLSIFSLNIVFGNNLRNTFFSDTVKLASSFSPPLPIFATYGYGDRNVLNYYSDRACVVLGSVEPAHRSAGCVVLGPSMVQPGQDLVILVYRDFASREVAEKTRFVGEGWHQIADFSNDHGNHALLLEAVEKPLLSRLLQQPPLMIMGVLE